MDSHNSTASDVDLVFRDLEDAYKELKDRTSSPKTMRRTFIQFVDLSQKLTSMMRKEYKQKTGKEWVADKFSGWDDTTQLLKHLRNKGQHEYTIRIQLMDIYKIPVNDIFDDPDNDPNPSFVVVGGKWNFGDDYDDKLPDPIKVIPADPKTGAPGDREIKSTRREISYLLEPKTQEIKNLIQRAGSNDIHILSDHCYSVLSSYYRYYKKA